MPGGNSFGRTRTTRSSADLNSAPSLVTHNVSTPIQSVVHDETFISNVSEISPNNEALPDNTSPPLSSPTIHHDEDTLPIPNSIASTQPIYNTTRPLIELSGNTFDASHPAFGVLKHIIHSHYDGAYTCFSEVSVDTKELWWKEFQKRVQWNKGCCYDDVVLKAFKHNASTHIISMTSKARSGGVRPLWMAEDTWKDLLKKWKECPKFLKRSKINKSSRAVATELGMPPYAGGSISVSVHKRKLRDELKREPTPKETFEKCYTKKDGTCVGKKAEETVEAYDKLFDQATELAAAAEGSSEVDLNGLWINAAGGAKKGKRVFGMGSEAREVLQTQYVMNSPSTYSKDSVGNVQDEMRASVKEVREEISQNNHHWEKMFEQLIQGQTTLAEQMNALVKKKRSRGI